MTIRARVAPSAEVDTRAFCQRCGPAQCSATSGALICRDWSGQAVEINRAKLPMSDPAGRSDPRPGHGSPDLPVQSFFAADASTQTTPLLPSWSAITVSEGASLSSTTVPPAATAAAIRCSATSGAT